MPIADAQCEGFIMERYNILPTAQIGLRVNVSTSNVVDCVRALICRGTVEHDRIEILFNGEDMKVDVNGRIPNWPEGFCDYMENWTIEILGGRVKPQE